MTPSPDIYAKALKFSRQGENSRWQEERAIRVALKAGGTIRDYAKLRDGNWDSEQRYSNWIAAGEFRDLVSVTHEGEVAQLLDAGLHFISYWSEVGRLWKDGADAVDCLELLTDCVTTDGLKGVAWLRAKIDGITETPEDWNKVTKYIERHTVNAPYVTPAVSRAGRALVARIRRLK